MSLRDLASTLPADLDLGVTDAVLQGCIEKMDAFQAQARLQLFQSLAAAISTVPAPEDGSVTDDMCSQLDSGLATICGNASYLMPDTSEAQLLQYGNHFRTLTFQVASVKAQLSQLQVGADLEEQIAEFQNLIQHGSIGDAAWVIVRLKKTLQGLTQPAAALAGTSDPNTGATPGVGLSETDLAGLNSRCSSCEAQLNQILEAGVGEALHIDSSQHMMMVRRKLACGTNTSELWTALGALSQLQPVLTNMASQILHQVLEPVFTGEFYITVVAPQGEGEAAVLHWKPQLNSQAHTIESTASHEPEKCCQQTLKILAEHLFDFDESMLRQWGELLWQQLCDSYVRLHAGLFVKAHLDDSEGCAQKLEAAQGLEEFAESLWITEEPYLVPAVEALSRQALDDRQRHYLEEARAILVAQTYEALPAGNKLQIDSDHYKRLLEGQLQPWQLEDPPCGHSTTGPVLASGKYMISRAGFGLAKLVEQLLEDASTSGTASTAQALVRTISKVALMARQLPSALDQKQQRLQVPQIALLNFNDLHHLASTLLILPACYAPEIEALLREVEQEKESSPEVNGEHDYQSPENSQPTSSSSLSQLNEDALMLREAANKAMKEQVGQQSLAFHDILLGLDGLKRIGTRGSGQTGIAYRKTVSQLMHSLSRLGRMLLENLTPAHVVELGSSVLGNVCGELSSFILDMRDIGVDDCTDLKDLLTPFAADALPSLLGMPTTPGAQPATPELSGVPVQVLFDSILHRCKPLRKLKMLLTLLDARLKEIAGWWEAGSLQAAGLGVDEVVHLLRALFEDSQHRRAAISKVQEAAW